MAAAAAAAVAVAVAEVPFLAATFSAGKAVTENNCYSLLERVTAFDIDQSGSCAMP